MIDIKTSAIRELVAPVVAFLRHDIARPDAMVHMDLEWAEMRLTEVLKILNDTHAAVVEPTERELRKEPTERELREMIQENLARRD